MIVNALLVCWNGGWFRLEDPAAIAAAGFRAEGFLSLGAQYDEGEAYRQAQQVLTDYRETGVELEARIDPAEPGKGAPAPYQGWRPTNVIQVAGRSQRVRSMRVQLRDDGPEFTPGFGKRARSEPDRFATAIKKFSPGVMAGDTAIPTPMSGFSPQPMSQGEACTPYAVSGVSRAVIELKTEVTMNIYVVASVGGYSEFYNPDWKLWPVVPAPTEPPPEGTYWYLRSPFGPILDHDRDWFSHPRVSASLVYADLIPPGEHEIGAEIDIPGAEDEPAMWITANILVCPANGDKTVDWALAFAGG